MQFGALDPRCTTVQVHGDPNEPSLGAGAAGAPCVTLTLALVDKILATIAEHDLKQKLQAFEQAQLATRDEAIAAAMERKEEAAAADDSCSCHVHVCIGADITYQLILIS